MTDRHDNQNYLKPLPHLDHLSSCGVLVDIGDVPFNGEGHFDPEGESVRVLLLLLDGNEYLGFATDGESWCQVDYSGFPIRCSRQHLDDDLEAAEREFRIECCLWTKACLEHEEIDAPPDYASAVPIEIHDVRLNDDFQVDEFIIGPCDPNPFNLRLTRPTADIKAPSQSRIQDILKSEHQGRDIGDLWRIRMVDRDPIGFQKHTSETSETSIARASLLVNWGGKWDPQLYVAVTTPLDPRFTATCQVAITLGGPQAMHLDYCLDTRQFSNRRLKEMVEPVCIEGSPAIPELDKKTASQVSVIVDHCIRTIINHPDDTP